MELYSSFAVPRIIEESSKEEEREGQEMYMGESPAVRRTEMGLS